MSFYLRVPAECLEVLYLFLSAEGRISDAAFALFEEIGSSCEKFGEKKGEIVGNCEKLLMSQNDGKSRLELVKGELSKKASSGAGDYASGFSWFDIYKRKNAEFKRFVLSILINVMYQAKLYSDTKAELVNIWRSQSKIDESIFLEMKDTAVTLAELAEYRKWLLAGNNSTSQAYIDELARTRQEVRGQLSNLIVLG
jgi:hypothetical protein